MGFWDFPGISMDSNGILWFLWDPNGILGFLWDPTGILGFLCDPNGSQWDFEASL